MADMLNDAVCVCVCVCACVCVCVCVCVRSERGSRNCFSHIDGIESNRKQRERERESWRSDCIITVSLAELVISLSCQQEVEREEKRTNHHHHHHHHHQGEFKRSTDT